MEYATSRGMKNTNLFTIFMLLFWSGGLHAEDQRPGVNIDERLIVESVAFDNEGGIEISQTLRDEAQKLVGEKYSTKLTNAFANKIRREMKAYRVGTIDVTVDPGEKHGYVKLTFQLHTNSRANVNERYVVESVAFAGEGETKVSQALRDEAQKLEGKKYSEISSNDLADRLRQELPEYTVVVKVERGEKPEHVKVVFQIEKLRVGTVASSNGNGVGFVVPFTYHSKQGWGILAGMSLYSHHNVFTFTLVNDADQLLERNAGWSARYEHEKIGTDLLRLRIDFDSYHQKFNPATEAALSQRPDVPGIYRARQNFAPSLTLHPAPDLMLSAGVSFQRLEVQYPSSHTKAAYAGTADIRYGRKAESQSGYKQNFSGSYSLRTATRILDSDYVYTRHFITADYTLSKGRNLFGAHFLSGFITGTAPLFERFALGNTNTLRGWDKFDVSPLGGTRAAHGSLEYRYGQFQIFYDVGTEWEAGMSGSVRHGLGFGWVHKNMFASLAFPVRLNHVAPIFMMGLRPGAQ
jgi:hypothetical protein